MGKRGAKSGKQTGETPGDKVIGGPADKGRKTCGPLDRAKLDDLCGRIAALPVLDTRCAEEILGYDEFGSPS